MESPEFAQENKTARARIQETHEFISTLTSWTNEMLRLSVGTMKKVLKLGAGIQKLLH